MGYGIFWQSGPATTQCPGERPWRRMMIPLAVLSGLVVVFLAPPALDPNGLPQLALTFGGMSLMLFGGGYVFIPIIQDVVVSHYQRLTTQQFLDGLTLSQVTPGPILVIAAFIAQKVMTEQSGVWWGFIGALVGTLAIFTSPAILMVTASWALEDMKQSPGVQATMRGVRCGVLGMIAVAALIILHTSLPTWPETLSITTLGSYLSMLWPTLMIFATALVALVKYRVDVVWTIPISGLLGVLLY